MADFNHTDYTEELNVIIVALARILDDVRVLRRRGEDASVGIVTNKVFNDFERALMLAGMSAGGSGDVLSVAREINNPTPTSMDGGQPTDPGVEEQRRDRASLLEALGLDSTEERTIIRKGGLYYFEKAPEPGSWGSNSTNPIDRAAITEKYKFVEDGGAIGYEDNDTGTPKPGSPPSADKLNPSSPRARWPFVRPDGRTLPTNDGISDLYDPITNTVPSQTREDIIARSRDPNIATSPVTQPFDGTQSSTPPPYNPDEEGPQ